MKILSLFVLRVAGADTDPIPLAKAFYLDDLNIFQKESARAFATTTSTSVARRLEVGQRSTVAQEGLLVHVHVHASGLATVAVCDREYPARVAFSVLRAVHDEFVARHSRTWEGATGPLAFPGLEGIIRRYQKPDGTGKATKEAQSWIMWAAIVVLLGVLFKLVSGGNLIVTPPPKPEL